MERTRTRGMILASLVTIVILAVVVAVVLLVNSDTGFAGCTSAMQFGWIAPLIAASIIGGLAWVLLSQDQTSDDDVTNIPAAECPECGRTVMGAWRMCPYCGEVLDPRYSRR